MNMIHSMAGGKLQTHNNHDYVKVRIIEGEYAGNIIWYLSTSSLIKEDSLVLVPVGRGNIPAKGKVIRVDHDVNELSFPVPIKKMKKILEIL